MKKNPFKLFIGLVSFDQEARLLQQEIETLESQVANLEEQQKAVMQELQDAKNSVVEMRKKVDEYELTLKELDQQERDKKSVLNKITNFKEYQSLKSEVEKIQQEQLNQEQLVLETWGDLETAQGLVKGKKEEYDEKVASLQKAIKENKKKIKLLRSNVAVYGQERAKREETIPKEWLEKYTIMKARVPNPVVPITQGACSACFYALTSQDVIQGKKGKLLQCNGCYRLLYLLEAMEREALNK